MKRIIYSMMWLLLFFGCGDEQPMIQKTRPFLNEDSMRLRMQEFLTLNDSVKSYLLNDDVFLTLCDSLDTREFLRKKHTGEIPDTVVRNFPLLYTRLIEFGQEKNIKNIIAYYTDYCRTRFYKFSSLTRDLSEVIVSGDCLLGREWQEEYYVCYNIFEAGLRQFYAYGGCCREKFWYSVVNNLDQMVADRKYFLLFIAVNNPANLYRSCEEFVDLMNDMNFDPYDRMNALMELEYVVGELVWLVAQTPDSWNGSCSCGKGHGGGSAGGIPPPPPPCPYGKCSGNPCSCCYMCKGPCKCSVCHQDPCKCIRSVTVLITGNIIGEAVVKRGDGQYYLYYTPVYQMVVSSEKGGTNFKVIRFGVDVRNGILQMSGLYEAYECIATYYDPNYLAISGINSGAWKIRDNFLIHGGPQAKNTAVVSWGCVELCGQNAMSLFKQKLLEFSGAGSQQALADSKKLTIKLEATNRPPIIRIN